MKIKITLTDDKGSVFEGETELQPIGKPMKQVKVKRNKVSTWYKKGSTIEKIVRLIEGGFFNNARSLNEIIDELKSKDYHFKPSDLTLPLRKIVRKGLLKRTKDLPAGKKSKNWLYVKV